MKHRYYLFMAVIISTLLTGCVSVKPMYFEDDKKLAMQAVEKYYQLYNEKNFEEIYNGVHEEAKATKDKQKLIAMLGGIYETEGKVGHFDLVASNVKMRNAKERQVELLYKTQHENGKRNETFLVVTNDSIGKIYSFGELSDNDVKNLSNTNK